IGHHRGLIDGGPLLVGEQDAVLLLLDLDLAHLALLDHGVKGVVVHLPDLPLSDPGHGQEVEEHQDQQHDYIVVDQRLFGCFYLIHVKSPFCSSRVVLCSAFCCSTMADSEAIRAYRMAWVAKSMAYSAYRDMASARSSASL